MNTAIFGISASAGIDGSSTTEGLCGFEARMVACALGAFDLVRLYAYVFEGNVASKRVLVKNGFLCEGVLRQSVFKKGRLLDQKLFARLGGEGPRSPRRR